MGLPAVAPPCCCRYRCRTASCRRPSGSARGFRLWGRGPAAAAWARRRAALTTSLRPAAALPRNGGGRIYIRAERGIPPRVKLGPGRPSVRQRRGVSPGGEAGLARPRPGHRLAPGSAPEALPAPRVPCSLGWDGASWSGGGAR